MKQKDVIIRKAQVQDRDSLSNLIYSTEVHPESV